MTTTYDRPHVLMMSEITADGKLTLKKGASSKILMKYMAPETETLLHTTRAEYDAIMVGANTIRIDNSFLTVRLVPGKARSVSSRAAWQISRLTPMCWGPMRQRRSRYAKRPRKSGSGRSERKAPMLLLPGKTHVELPLLMKILREKFGVKKLMIEGGPTLNWHMLHDRLVDEIRLIHLPFIVGGSDTPSLVGGMHINSEDEMIRLNLKKYYMCGSNLVSEFDVLYTGV